MMKPLKILRIHSHVSLLIDHKNQTNTKRKKEKEKEADPSHCLYMQDIEQENPGNDKPTAPCGETLLQDGPLVDDLLGHLQVAEDQRNQQSRDDQDVQHHGDDSSQPHDSPDKPEHQAD